MRFEIRGQCFEALPERALFWHERSTLLLADVHLGKDQVFRRHGVGLPRGLLEDELTRMDKLLTETGARRLLVLGDWVHAAPRPGDDWPERIAAWRQRHQAVEMTVILGNHDRDTGTLLERWGLRPVRRWDEGGFRFRHHPEADEKHFTFAGHLHPGYVLAQGGDRLRLPVLWLRPEMAVLPAFGRFTGTALVQPRRGDRLLAFGGDAPVDLSPLIS